MLQLPLCSTGTPPCIKQDNQPFPYLSSYVGGVVKGGEGLP